MQRWVSFDGMVRGFYVERGFDFEMVFYKHFTSSSIELILNFGSHVENSILRLMFVE